MATDPKYAPLDPAAVAAQFEAVPEEELDMVQSKLDEARVKRGIAKPGPDFARMSDGELREYTRKNHGF